MTNDELEFKVNVLNAQLKVQDERIDLLYQRLNHFESQVRGTIFLTPSPFGINRTIPEVTGSITPTSTPLMDKK